MGIHGVFKEINASSKRISLAKYSSDFLATHDRPLVLAIDIAIWLFQIQSGKGGSNPALRTFYYRLLRLISLNIWPVFVFDGPHKPTWKRNKKVGGPGVRVVSVPEFLAKELLRKFGFPVHIAPGEAEAECALLQREGIVDAVMSEDVDTLMFGAGVLLRSWTPEGSSKTPTHVTVYTKEEISAQSKLDPAGMTLVALMSGGDYIVEGIPGCGPKVACDAARAGFGEELCKLARSKDTAGLQAWRERLQHEVRTNTSKFFSRKNSSLVIPDDFPNLEVLGYYTHPRVSGRDALDRLKREMKWDQTLAFQELREFTKDAFDWRCVGGAKKFVRNLAPALLIRELRVRGHQDSGADPEAQEARERSLVAAVHGKRTHATTDGELEYRVSFVPMDLVPIDLSIEEPDEEDTTATAGADSDAENEDPAMQIVAEDGEAPGSPTKKRALKPYHPEQPEKLWVLKSFLQMGSPLLIEDYEAGLRLGKTKKNAGASTAGAKKPATRATRHEKKADDMPRNALLAYASISKAGVSKTKSVATIDISEDSVAFHATSVDVRETSGSLFSGNKTRKQDIRPSEVNGCVLPTNSNVQAIDMTTDADGGVLTRAENPIVLGRILCEAPALANGDRRSEQFLKLTPKKRNKRILVPSPSPARSQKTIESYWSPSRDRRSPPAQEVIDLLSSSPTRDNHCTRQRVLKPQTPSPPNLRTKFVRCSGPIVYPQTKEATNARDATALAGIDLARAGSPIIELPASVTQRSKKRQRTAARCGRGVMERVSTAPVYGHDDDGSDSDALSRPCPASDDVDRTPTCLRDLPGVQPRPAAREASSHVDLTSSSPQPAPMIMSSDGHDNADDGNDDDDDDDADDLPDISTFALRVPSCSRFGRATGSKEQLLGAPTPTLHQDIEPPELSWRPTNVSDLGQPLMDVNVSVTTVLTSALPASQLPRKRIFRLRESLPGAFREDDDVHSGEVTMTGIKATAVQPANNREAERNYTSDRRRWRKSGVEILDLTYA